MRLVFREVDRDKYQAVADGRKKVETRAATSKYRDLRPGQDVTITCGKDSVGKRVVRASHYHSAEELLTKEGLANVMPGVETLEEAMTVYYSFPGYRDKIARYGLIALELV